jgi:ribonuclease VapC
VIAIDSSAIVAIAFEEPEGALFARTIVQRKTLVGAPVLVEANIVLRRRLSDDADRFIDRMIEMGELTPEPFTADMYLAARDSFARYGKGTGHPAQLNFGDCLSYAVAKVRGIPLLYKGQDFARTDISAAL